MPTRLTKGVHMNRRRVFSAIILTMSLVMGNVGSVIAMPPMPSSFYGTVKLNGANVADGTNLSAWINGVKYAETTVILYDGDSVYSLNVPGDDSDTPEIDGGVSGDTVSFHIGDLAAEQTGTWQSGTNVEFDITAVGNIPPEIFEGDLISITMSEDSSPTAFDLTLHASDIDDDTLTWSVSIPADHGVASASGIGTSIDVDYAPDVNYNGSDHFLVQVSDGNCGMDSIAVSITIGPINDAPLAVEDVYTAEMNVPLDVAAGAGILSNDSDAEGDPLTAILVDNPEKGILVLDPDGAFSYTPEPDFVGIASFTYQAHDGQDYSEVVTVEIVVTGIPVTGDNLVFLPALFESGGSSARQP